MYLNLLVYAETNQIKEEEEMNDVNPLKNNPMVPESFLSFIFLIIKSSSIV